MGGIKSVESGHSKEQKVFVAMSGGVDSSVAAALLKERGFDVHGVFIKTWQIPGLPCSAADDRRDAMRVAAALGIPFHTFDLSDEYKRGVVGYMLREYAAGQTPNPDVMCNKEIKFGAFFRRARDMGAQYVATGHYARVHEAKSQKPKAETVAPNQKTFQLFQSRDTNKDQTYFLWTLGQKELKHTLFPIGDYRKSEVRQMARERGLVTADKRDSQGLCFLGKIDVRAFLAEHIGAREGSVIEAASGRVIGAHAGAALYTLGQRHGFRVVHETPRSEPLYVVARDVDANTITVASRAVARSAPFARHEITLGVCNWINEVPQALVSYSCRTRHRGDLMPCRVELHESGTSRARVLFETPQLVAVGQSLVLYEDGLVAGGGVIE